MKSQLFNRLSILLLAITMSQFAFASPAGKVEFKDLSDSYGMPKVEINLSKALIGMVGSFAGNDDPDLKDMLSKIEGITVRVYNVGADTTKAMAEVEKISKYLRKHKWEPFVSVNEEKEKVQIFGKVTDGIMDGLVVMVVEENDDPAQPAVNEAVFINIVGEIDPNKVGQVTRALNIQ